VRKTRPEVSGEARPATRETTADGTAYVQTISSRPPGRRVRPRL